MVASNSSAEQRSFSGGRGLGFALLVFGLVMLVFFHRSFRAEMALFSNDGPLGLQQAEYASLPEGFTGYWQDLNWLGGPAGAAFPSLTYGVLWILGPLGYAKFYEPLCLLILGLSAWLALRSMGVGPGVCLVGGLAAALNSDLFSYTCWGLGSHALAVSSTFLALAALFAGRAMPRWMRLMLAGIATGMAVMEGFDSGAILSLYVATVVVVQALWEHEPEGQGSSARRWWRGLVRVGLVALVAGWTAAHALTVLIGTQVRGVVGMEQDAQTKAQRWDEATRWSLPRIEVLRLVIAGLHGYRLDTPDGGNYWGAVGRDPAWESYLADPNPDPALAPHPAGLRHSGAGFYTGVVVVLLALYAVSQALRGRSSAFDPDQRRWVLFWAAAALVSLLLALGRHAPFYQSVYALPYFSTIRNPIKFLHPFSLAMVILCAHGLHAALVQAVERQRHKKGVWTWKGWWSTAVGYERRFTLVCGVVLLSSVLGWLIYASSQSNLARHLQRVGFGEPNMAEAMAAHSVREVGWFVLFLLLGVGWLTLARSGFFRGARAVGLSTVLIGGVLVGDLVRANFPWVVYYNYREKYASNPVIDLLKERAFERRVSGLFLGGPGPETAQALQVMQQVYGLDWLQHLFPYYNIQALDIVQDPRPSADNQSYRAAFLASDQKQLLQRQIRQWELTSTRFLVSLAGVEGLLDQQLDSGQGRFRLRQGFRLYQEAEGSPIRAAANDVGPYGIVEFAGALPKVSLYSRWQVIEDETAVLNRLVDPAFDPAASVVLEQDPWPDKAISSEATAPGTVVFEGYAPKRIRLSVDAPVRSVLLLNDKFHPDWEATLDGEPVEILRANFLMRGVAVPEGRHLVEFRYRPSVATWYLSLVAVLTGAGLCGAMLTRGLKRR